MSYLTDGLRNLVANLATGRDKAASAQYVMPIENRAEYLAAYLSSSLVRRAVDLPAEDSCREWREWQAEAVDISKIEAEEKRLDLQGKIKEARRQARLYGGAAILIGTGENNLTKELSPDRIKAGGIKYLTVLSRDDLSPGEIERDISSRLYNEPQYWTLSGERGVLQLHPSRLVLFHGVPPLAGLANQTQYGWGCSVLTGMLDAIKRVDEGAANVNSLVYEAKVDVVKIPDFMSNLESRGQQYEQLVQSRLTLAMMSKGINGSLILDAEEDYEQKAASFGGLPDVLDRFMQLASAASGVPATLLFGMSPAGMNSTGESDIRLYYDRVRVEQTLSMQPAMGVLDECLIRSALGARPEGLFFNWRPLWQPTAAERAGVADKLMAAAEKLHRMDAVSTEALGQASVNALTESGAFPGLESYAEEFPVEEDDDPVVPFDPAEAQEVPSDEGEEQVQADAAPRTLYVRRNVLNAKDILAWAREQGFETTLAEDDLHVTIAFSRKPVDWMKVGTAWEEDLEVVPGGARIMDRFGDARVLLFASSALSWRHEEIMRSGATWDHPEYQPHITISYSDTSPDINEIRPYRGKIILGPEIFEEINEKWLEGVVEQ
ncbi:anti-CBASS protein Acb1 family protein [Halovulum sp. GXIMD14793]